jgi:integrase
MRQINRLSAQSLNQSEPGRYPDGLGLYLQVSPAAGGGVSRSWIFRYASGKRERQMGLGSLHTISLARARQLARDAREQLTRGVDPIVSRMADHERLRQEAEARLTFKEAATRFLAMWLPEWKNDKHRQQWQNTLATYTYPALGARLVTEIDARAINEAVEPIWKRTPETASRVRQRIERIVQWVKDGMPAPTVGRNVQHHPALPYEQLPAFLEALVIRPGIAARALEFGILTAARSGEIFGARWSEIDLDAAVWTIPAERMKAGAEHRVPLTARAVAVLRALPREGNGLVFAGPSGGSLSDAALNAVIRRMNRSGPFWTDPRADNRPVVPHGFRSTFRDWAGDQTNFPRNVAEAALAHTIDNKTEAAYRRSDAFDKRRKLMDAWAGFCSRPAGGSVVAMRRAG